MDISMVARPKAPEPEAPPDILGLRVLTGWAKQYVGARFNASFVGSRPGPAPIPAPFGPGPAYAPTPVIREVLPMSSGGQLVWPGESVTITARPQIGPFRPERLMFPKGGVGWLINDIKIGNQSMFFNIGDGIPGELFASGSDTTLAMPAVHVAQDIVLVATNVNAGYSTIVLRLDEGEGSQEVFLKSVETLVWTDGDKQRYRHAPAAHRLSELGHIPDKHRVPITEIEPRVVMVRLSPVGKHLYATDEGTGLVIWNLTAGEPSSRSTSGQEPEFDLDGITPKWMEPPEVQKAIRRKETRAAVVQRGRKKRRP
jgi:hypothetical protein